MATQESANPVAVIRQNLTAMTPETVRHYTKRSRALMVAQRVADRVTRGDVLLLKVGRGEKGR